jgi:hypothetical protein
MSTIKDGVKASIVSD